MRSFTSRKRSSFFAARIARASSVTARDYDDASITTSAEFGAQLARVRSGGMDYQEDRRAENEALFRTANENLARTAKRQQRPATTFICECNRESCLETLEVPHETYRRVRAASDQFLLIPGHENDPDEDVVECGDGYFIVDKKGVGEEVARRLA